MGSVDTTFVIKLCGLWPYVISFCNMKVSLEKLNLIDILTTFMKSKHIMYNVYYVYKNNYFEV